MTALDGLLAAREAEGRPIQVAMVGAGVTGRSIARHLLGGVPGIRLAAVCNRTIDRAVDAYRQAGADPSVTDSGAGLDRAIASGHFAVTADPAAVMEAGRIDLVVEVTGTVGHAARIATAAVENGKHLVLVNAELDSTLGPILARRARAAGLVHTNTDGDEPGVAMTLLRYLRSTGLRPVAAGNLKGMVDHYRTPDTQREFAERTSQDVRKVTSFADATKLSMEATVLANATGFRVAKRGMIGPACEHVREVADRLPAEAMLEHGLVDYALGAAPHTGAFVVVHERDSARRADLAYYKLGPGPFYVFYTPFHLPHIQLASTIARAALHHDPTVAPLDGPATEVVAVAKRDLAPGDELDGVGGYTVYGLIENRTSARAANALPMGFADGARVLHPVPRDQMLTLDDVALRPDPVLEALWAEQERAWPVEVS